MAALAELAMRLSVMALLLGAGALAVGEEVEIEINAEAIKDAAGQSSPAK